MISRSIPLKMRNFSDKIYKENQTFHRKILLASSRGKLIDKIKDDNIIWCINLACCITKATDIHSEYVTRIAFTRQKWLLGSAPVLRYTYITHICFSFRFIFLSYCYLLLDLLEFCVMKNWILLESEYVLIGCWCSTHIYTTFFVLFYVIGLYLSVCLSAYVYIRSCFINHPFLLHL